MIRRTIHVAIVVFCLSYCIAQPLLADPPGPVSSLQFPVRLQLYARNNTNTAAVPVTGTVSTANFDSIQVKIYKNNSLWKQQTQRLVYTNGLAPFDLTTRIDAGMYEYRFQLYLLSGSSLTLAASSDSVTCGDVYMIGGQSNAHPTDPLATYKNEFCRTLGVQTANENNDPYNPADTLWGLSTGVEGPGGIRSGPYLVGVWGLRLQQLILEKYHMPTALFNGAAGGDPIEAELRKANPLDLATVYGRMLYRLQRAHLADKIKGIFWYQGESNEYSYKDAVKDTTYYYYDFLMHLINAWKEDYPGVQKYYLFQLRPGCGGGHDPNLRDLQRTMGDSLPNMRVMSTAAVPAYNGCHFEYPGYIAIGDNIFRCVAQDFYQSTDTGNIHAPNIRRVFYTSAARNQIACVFGPNDTMVWPKDTLIWSTPFSMKDFFFFDADTVGRVVESARANGDTIILNLKQPLRAQKITYLPAYTYPGTPAVFMGPWITNTRGVGALIFHDFPISSAPTAVEDHEPALAPRDYSLDQNFPNPFNPSTSVQYSIREESDVRIDVFDILGRLVERLVDQTMPAGTYRSSFNASGHASGIYYYHLSAIPRNHPGNRFDQTRTMMVMK